MVSAKNTVLATCSDTNRSDSVNSTEFINPNTRPTASQLHFFTGTSSFSAEYLKPMLVSTLAMMAPVRRRVWVLVRIKLFYKSNSAFVGVAIWQG